MYVNYVLELVTVYRSWFIQEWSKGIALMQDVTNAENCWGRERLYGNA